MLDSGFKRLCLANTPKINHHLSEGLASYYVKHFVEYIDGFFESSIKNNNLPQIKYEGYRYVTPQEEAGYLSANGNYDIAKSDIYSVAYIFSFEGRQVRRLIQIPNVSKGDLMYLNGTLYNLFMVLSDKMIMPEHGGRVFIKVLRDKVMPKRMPYSILINDIVENDYIVSAKIYRQKSGKSKPSEFLYTRSLTTIGHYLFGKYGFTQTFKKYLNITPILGTDKEITKQAYPSNQYVLFKSRQVKPKTALQTDYVATNLVVAIKKEEYSLTVKSLLTSFYYIVDHFPNLITKESVDVVDKESGLYEVWLYTIGLIISGLERSEPATKELVRGHYASLERYVDDMVKKMLEQQFKGCFGRKIENFYDELFIVLENFNKWVIMAESNNMDPIFERYLEILYYLAYTIIESFNTMSFNWNRKINSNKPIRPSDVDALFRELRGNGIYTLQSGHVAASPAMFATDNFVFGPTSRMGRQASAPGNKRMSKKRSHGVNVMRTQPINMGIGYNAGSSKTALDPAQATNHLMHVDLATGIRQSPPDMQPFIDRLNTIMKDTVNSYVPVFEDDSDDE